MAADALEKIPMLPLKYKKARTLLKLFYPIAVPIALFMPSLKEDLKKIKTDVTPSEFIASAMLAMVAYTALFFLLQAIISIRSDDFFEPDFILSMFFIAFFLGLAVFFYILLVPKWIITKIKSEMERDLFFATRHLMIHTSAGVPLYEALVSLSQEYEDENFNYGEVSTEFANIIKEVKGGKELTQALEESASKSTSFYYRRLVWQLANANKSGSNVGAILRHMVEFLSKEQETLLKNYGAQLNPIAMFYMMACIIAPTMAIILIAIASALIDINVGPATFLLITVLLIVTQFMFFGMLKSRRPSVSL